MTFIAVASHDVAGAASTEETVVMRGGVSQGSDNWILDTILLVG